MLAHTRARNRGNGLSDWLARVGTSSNRKGARRFTARMRCLFGTRQYPKPSPPPLPPSKNAEVIFALGMMMQRHTTTTTYEERGTTKISRARIHARKVVVIHAFNTFREPRCNEDVLALENRYTSDQGGAQSMWGWMREAAKERQHSWGGACPRS